MTAPETRLSRIIARIAAPATILMLMAFAGMRLAATPERKHFFDSAHWMISTIAAAAIAWIGVRHAQGIEHRARRYFAAALTAYWLGLCLWDVQAAIHWNPFPGPADLFFLYGSFGCLPGFWVALRARLTPSQLGAVVLDTATLSLAGLSVTLAVYLPIAKSAQGLQLLVFVLYPTLLIAAASLNGIVILALRPRFHWSLALLLLALLGRATIWLMWNKLILLNEVESGTWIGACFSVFTLLIGIGAAYWRIDGISAARGARIYDMLSRMLPLAVVTTIGIADLLVALNKQTDPAVLTSSAALSLLVIVLAVIRQSLLLSVSDRLLAAERRAAENESRFRRLTENVKDMIFRFSVATRQFDYVSPAAETIFGFTPEEWRANPTMLRKHIREDHRQVFDDVWRSIRRGKAEVMREYPIIHRNGETRWISLRSVVVRDDSGKIQFVEGILSDITSLKHSEERFAFLAHHDSLTSLPNRLLFEMRLEQALARAQRHQTCFAVLFIDLDQFKTINDSLGHEVGDRLLVQISERMLSRMRREDTLARWGGDEFTALIEDLASADDAAVIAQSLLDAAATPLMVAGDQNVALGASIGVSLYPDDSHAAQDLIRNSDTAMFAAKSRGGGQLCFYSAAMTEKAHERLVIRNNLRRALDRGELFLVYQPVVSVASGRIVGAEALLRWQHRPDLLIPPDKFIPVAESSGLINVIGAWVLGEACRQGRAWAERDPGFILSVNVSPRQIQQMDFGKVLRDTLQRWNMPAAQLMLEITESTIMEAGEEAHQVVASLRTLGVGIAVDDFGTGLSSLSSLKRFDVDMLKIDKSFVLDIPGDRDDMEIARTIVAMGHNLELGVTAEGVETQEQLAFLKQCGCDHYQGFLFSAGVTADQFERLLAVEPQASTTVG